MGRNCPMDAFLPDKNLKNSKQKYKIFENNK